MNIKEIVETFYRLAVQSWNPDSFVELEALLVAHYPDFMPQLIEQVKEENTKS